MKIEENKLILEDEINDEMLDELISLLQTQNLETVQIDTNNISSLALQQLFCISKDIKVVVNDPFTAKFFENIEFKAA
jgi:diketogulonate reductase-like aldo/keto reductase